MVSQFVYKKGIVSTNYQILKKDRVSAYHYRILMGMLLKAEFAAKNSNLVNTIKSQDELDKNFKIFLEEGKAKTKITAQFASPGWTTFLTELPLIQLGLFWVLVSIANRGGKVEMGEFKMELNASQRPTATEKFTDFALKLLEKWLLNGKDNTNVRDVLEIKKPGAEIDLAQLEDKKNENED